MTPPLTPPQTSFKVDCTTTKGPISLSFIQAQAPIGYQRMYELFTDNYFNNQSMYRMIPNFLVQFGVTSNAALNKKYTTRATTLQDDPHFPDPSSKSLFKKGDISYAGSGKNSRAADIFICLSTPSHLGGEFWEVPVGHISSGMDVVDSFYSGYKEMNPFNKKGVNQNKLRSEGGVDYVNEKFPLLDRILECNIIVSESGGGEFEGLGLPPSSSITKTATVTSNIDSNTAGSGSESKVTADEQSLILLLLSMIVLVVSAMLVGRTAKHIFTSKRSNGKKNRFDDGASKII